MGKLYTIIPTLEMENDKIKISLDLPQTWSDLTEAQLRYVLQLRASSTMSAYEIRIAALLRFAGMEERQPHTDAERELQKKEGYHFMRVSKIANTRDKILPLPEWFFLDAVNRLSWLDTPSNDVTRLEKIANRYKPYDAQMSDMPFGVYLQVENQWQSGMAWAKVHADVQQPDQVRQSALAHVEHSLDEIARLLYVPQTKWYLVKPRPLRTDALMRQNILHWLSGWHSWAAIAYPHLFRPSGNADATVITSSYLQDQIDSQISALTDGDVTKLPHILEKTTTSDALHILDIKAKEAHAAKKAQEEAAKRKR